MLICSNKTLCSRWATTFVMKWKNTPRPAGVFWSATEGWRSTLCACQIWICPNTAPAPTLWSRIRSIRDLSGAESPYDESPINRWFVSHPQRRSLDSAQRQGASNPPAITIQCNIAIDKNLIEKPGQLAAEWVLWSLSIRRNYGLAAWFWTFAYWPICQFLVVEGTWRY